MHFNQFTKYYEQLNHAQKLSLEEVVDNLRYENLTHNTENAKFQLKDIFDHYNSYSEKTRNGEHGFTAQYLMTYIEYIENYQMFEYSIRTSNFDMYVYSAHKMCSLFFTFNHQNYARWLAKNVDDLMNIDKTHSGLGNLFENGALSVRRTPKNFCRSPVDLTLEQTINANAANKLKGISAFTNSIYARQRWVETHAARKAIITHIMGYLKLDESNENSTTDRKNNIFKNQVQKFIETVDTNFNPFSADLCRSKLFNLSTGKPASDDTTKFLLNSESNGFDQMLEFIQQCRVDIERFGKPIKRNVICNFASETFKRIGKPKNNVDEV